MYIFIYARNKHLTSLTKVLNNGSCFCNPNPQMYPLMHTPRLYARIPPRYFLKICHNWSSQHSSLLVSSAYILYAYIYTFMKHVLLMFCCQHLTMCCCLILSKQSIHSNQDKLLYYVSTRMHTT